MGVGVSIIIFIITKNLMAYYVRFTRVRVLSGQTGTICTLEEQWCISAAFEDVLLYTPKVFRKVFPTSTFFKVGGVGGFTCRLFYFWLPHTTSLSVA